MEMKRVLISIGVMVAATFLTRVLSFLVFRDRTPPKVVRYLEEVIPPMVMVILVLYCLKDVKWGLFPNGIPELLGIGLVAGLHLWKGNALVSIFGGTAFYMVLVQSGVFS